MILICFPGRGGDIVTEAAEADIAYGETWKNPLTQLEETIDGEARRWTPNPPSPERQGRVRQAPEANL